MSKNKKIKGSAYTTSDGGFVFTPYASVSEKDKSLHCVRSGRYAQLWVGKKTCSVRLSFDKKFPPPYKVWIEEITEMYNSLKDIISNDI